MNDFRVIFKADVNNINAYLKLSKDIDVEIDTAQMEVKFTADIDFRSGGIEGITATVQSVLGEVEWYVATDELTDQDKAEITAAEGVEMRNGNWEGKFEVDSTWEIWDNLSVKEEGHLYISEVEIDCTAKVITVS